MLFDSHMDKRNRIRSMLAVSMHDYAGYTGAKIDLTEDMPLLGSDAPLDSLGLVTVLASFEAAINDAFGTRIVLADERAMSMERSPFRTMGSLIDYAWILLEKNGTASE
jgi:hypothetical protein